MYSQWVKTKYEEARCSLSDINEHVPVLRSLASDATVSTICEMGVRGGVSTFAFLRALLDKPASQPCRLTGYDLSEAPPQYTVTRLEDRDNIQVAFQRGDNLAAPPASCDLLFIDTFHVYGQLKRELALHSPGTRRYIAMHDTVVDGERSEVIRLNWDADRLVAQTGIPREEILRGLWPAVTEFLAENPQWVLSAHYENNNGLTVLQRISD